MRRTPPAFFVLRNAVVVVWLLFHFQVADLQQVVTTTTSYETYSISSFNDVANGTTLLMLKDAGYGQGALQVTPFGLNYSAHLANKSGRIVFTIPFKLWEGDDDASNSVASFNTDFDVIIYRPGGAVPGEGFAFVILPSLDAPPSGSERGFLGLTNATLDGNPDNHLVAIEFDTVKQSYDPNDNHVGLNVNSVVSDVAAEVDIPIAPVNVTNYTVWVDYDGIGRAVSVYMAVSGTPKPFVPVLNTSLDLSRHVRRYSYFGFSASTGATYELNCVLSWNLKVQNLSKLQDLPKRYDDGATARGKLSLKIAAPLGATVALASLLAGLYVRRWRRQKAQEERSEMVANALRRLPGMPREFDIGELKKATGNFDEKMKLGQGGFGVVYRGMLPGEDTEVAVKKFLRDRTKGLDDFLSELTVINRLRHKNLVPLLGWCHRNGALLLVYEFMSNGSLDQHLFGNAKTLPVLGWYRRYTIIAGAANALHYLHHEYNPMVVHRDIKASNIMLDATFNARLGDFGLARTLDAYKTSVTDHGVVGTRGYIASECCITHKFTRESDVYAFGAVVLEVVCGRRPLCRVAGFDLLADWVWSLHGEGRILDAMDARLGSEYVAEDAKRLLLLGLACSHPLPGARPKTHAIVQIMSRSVAPPEVPSNKPAFVWPPEGPIVAEDCDAMSSTSAGAAAVTTTSNCSNARATPASSLEVQVGEIGYI
ncbi:probable L-type lectin-domain containing receptor kinase S.5 [Musa acuminata AAA Group]|uniref:probable L-type lectin-domain containing receptor kinase S.5 n=1 Tax=Musa acuminata AAA Group TaxID=214697 RepID=UPI0031CFB92B